jgi:predicted TPR repeat methyltransferase
MDASSLNDRGLALWKRGDSVGALDAFECLVAGDPRSPEAHYNLGCVQLELGKFAAADQSAQAALTLRPMFSEALLLRAAAVAATGAIEAAAQLLQQPASAAQRHMSLALRLMNSRLFDPARRCLEAVLREDPTEVMAHHLLSALSGDNPDHPVEGYVRQLFDASAATFDRELVSKLGYEIPREMVEAIEAIAGAGAPRASWDVLDLGCGTGLVGERIAPHSRRLVGIDLAPKMLERARARNIYTDLICADLIEALAEADARQVRYDVVTAADVFIYVGKLDTVIPAIRRVLRPGGLFAFSAEAVEFVAGREREDYCLGVMGRYAHGADHLRRLSVLSGFGIESWRQTRIRFEHRSPVEGWLTVWRAIE